MVSSEASSRGRFSLIEAMLFGCAIGLAGVIMTATPLGRSLEQDFGLSLLFGMRGPLPHPGGAVIIGIDTQVTVSDETKNPEDTTGQWDRRILANLIDVLVDLDVSVIAVDLFFSKQHEDAEDERLQRAIKNADRVVLYQELKKNNELKDVIVEPLTRFRKEASGLGSFVLPSIPERADYFWPFFHIEQETDIGAEGNTGDGSTPLAYESPSLPLAALHLQVKRATDPRIWESLLPRTELENENSVHEADHFLATIGELRARTRQHELLQFYLQSTFPDSSNEMSNALYNLIMSYSWPSIRHINFYGPAATIPTINSTELIRSAESNSMEHFKWLRDKVVFVGYVPDSPDKQVGRYLTNFIGEDRLDLSSVEIAATAYLNLRHRQWIRPTVPLYRTLLVFLFGFVVAFTTLKFRPTISITAVFTLSTLTLTTILWKFGADQLWLPVIIPIGLQLPAAVTIGLLWQFLRTRQERNLYRQGLRLYVPRQAVENIEAKGDFSSEPELTYCTCLFADIAEFTPLSEGMSALQLAQFSTEYFTPLNTCIQNNSGDVLSTVGDEILAVWTASDATKAPRILACDASLQMLDTIREFNNKHQEHSIFTRFGIHTGWLVIGNIGGGGHASYSIVGDVVNSAKRIEELNKNLNTQFLVTGEVIDGLDKFHSRRVGSFFVKGKSQPLEAYELCCIKQQASERQLERYAKFSVALEEFVSGNYQTSQKLFNIYRENFEHNGPAEFYLELLSNPQKMEEMVDSDGSIHLAGR
jgi:adenylate cyclase